jgi:tyrosyl-tRNA synthetase
MMKFSEDLEWRGLIKDRTFEKVDWLDTPRMFYLGMDCNSADSLTIGNLAVVMLAKRLQMAGWKAVLLVGGATSLIGDPGGKNEERPLKTREEVARNVAGIKAQISQLFESEDFTLVDNYDWFKEIGYLEFLRDVGKHFSMTELVQRDFIATRMGEGGSGISYAEFSYNLIQGYDYWWLFKNHGVELQIGGSDQWGNMLSGAPLIRKKEGKEVHAMSIPLVVNKSTGVKFGKSEAGAVWLDAARTTPTQMYQFWINADDEGVTDYLKIYTMLSKEEIDHIAEEHFKTPAERLAQKRLAQEVTRLVHGDEEMQLAERVTAFLVGARTIVEADDAALAALRKEIPLANADANGSLIETLVATNLASSNSEARRLLQGNAVAINGAKVTRETFVPEDFTNGRLLLRRGKAFKDSALVELVDEK